jgi:hypothetical protein
MPRSASLALAAGIMLLAAWAIWSAWAWPLKAKLFPLAIGIPLFCLAAGEVLWTLLRPAPAEETEQQSPRRTLAAVAWMIGFFAAIVLAGFLIAVPLFVLAYLRIQGRESWTLSIIFTVALWAVFYGLFDRLLHLPFPPGWIQGWLGLV